MLCRKQQSLRRKQQGVASIEFGLGFMAFFLMCMLWAEIGYIAYVSSVNDLAIAEAAREAKKINVLALEDDKSQSHFMAQFKQALTEHSGLFGGLIDPEKFILTVRYFDDREAVKNYTVPAFDDCKLNESETEIECGESENSALAIYQVRYDYEPILSFFTGGSDTFVREVIVIQEYEREQFKI
ncbi:pilus assembly protein [Vibrio sp. SM6]|uniref:Pilus assembly protein n=1 Tax=Vibrio agarilyticus TaxID=2726741 RepID=A0A7X8TSH8_9VIBR|nr:TadE family protein [Vibrio agarilyticus]NLS13787.1 pilus assembly protein [Vibrio agarilyticus]